MLFIWSKLNNKMNRIFFKTTFLFLTLIQLNGMAQNNNPVIAHRGAWKEFNLPQNSIASLKKAIELKCYGSEFDVHLTKDAKMVVNHDHDFYGLDIEKHTLDELNTRKHPNGENIPTIEAYLSEGLKQNNTKLIFEIKTSKLALSRTYLMIDLIQDYLEGKNLEGQIEFILFSYEASTYLKKQLPTYKVSYLNGDKTPQEIKSVGLDGIDYYYKVYQENRTYLEDAQKLGLITNSWTVNKEEMFIHFIDQKMDVITTDYPAQFLEVFSQMKP